MVFSVCASRALAFSRKIKSVRENLIHNSAWHPVGCFKSLFVAGQLPRVNNVVVDPCVASEITHKVSYSVRSVKLECVPVKTSFCRSEITFPYFALVRRTAPQHSVIVTLAVSAFINYNQMSLAAFEIERNLNSQMNRGSLFDRTDRIAVKKVS